MEGQCAENAYKSGNFSLETDVLLEVHYWHNVYPDATLGIFVLLNVFSAGCDDAYL